MGDSAWRVGAQLGVGALPTHDDVMRQRIRAGPLLTGLIVALAAYAGWQIGDWSASPVRDSMIGAAIGLVVTSPVLVLTFFRRAAWLARRATPIEIVATGVRVTSPAGTTEHHAWIEIASVRERWFPSRFVFFDAADRPLWTLAVLASADREIAAAIAGAARAGGLFDGRARVAIGDPTTGAAAGLARLGPLLLLVGVCILVPVSFAPRVPPENSLERRSGQVALRPSADGSHLAFPPPRRPRPLRGQRDVRAPRARRRGRSRRGHRGPRGVRAAGAVGPDRRRLCDSGRWPDRARIRTVRGVGPALVLRACRDGSLGRSPWSRRSRGPRGASTALRDRATPRRPAGVGGSHRGGIVHFVPSSG